MSSSFLIAFSSDICCCNLLSGTLSSYMGGEHRDHLSNFSFVISVSSTLARAPSLSFGIDNGQLYLTESPIFQNVVKPKTYQYQKATLLSYIGHGCFNLNKDYMCTDGIKGIKICLDQDWSGIQGQR